VKTARVYLAGPIGPDDDGRAARLEVAMRAGEYLRRAGLFPFVPHALVHWSGHSYECWMRYDQAWLDVCDAVLRLPGHSPGADREVARAAERALPVFDSLRALERWAAERMCS